MGRIHLRSLASFAYGSGFCFLRRTITASSSLTLARPSSSLITLEASNWIGWKWILVCVAAKLLYVSSLVWFLACENRFSVEIVCTTVPFPCLKFIWAMRYSYCSFLFNSRSICDRLAYHPLQYGYYTRTYLRRRNNSKCTNIRTSANINQSRAKTIRSRNDHGLVSKTTATGRTISNQRYA